MARRIQGSGSIYFDKNLNKYRGYITVNYEQGKQVRKYASAKTKKELGEKLEKLRITYQPNFLDTSAQNFGDFLDSWLEDVSRTKTEGTYKSYLYARRYLKPLDNVEIKRLGPQHFNNLLGEIMEEDKGRTAELVYSVAHVALQKAVRWRLISVNPVSLVDKPKYEKAPVVYWTVAQIKQFLKVARDHKHYPLYFFMLSTGCRIGEALALKWEDIDWDNNMVAIQRKLGWDRKGKPYFSDPKSAKSRRALVIPDSVMKVLKHEQEFPRTKRRRDFKDNGLVFSTNTGKVLTPSNLIKQSLEPLAKKAGLPRITLHQLRHSAASALLAAGVGLKQVSEMLGHSSVAITGDIYAHVDISLRRQTAEVMERIIGELE